MLTQDRDYVKGKCESMEIFPTMEHIPGFLSGSDMASSSEGFSPVQ